MKKILFICLGNICRLAAAEAVMKKLIDDEYLSKDFFIDSAGTIDYHKGHKRKLVLILYYSLTVGSWD